MLFNLKYVYFLICNKDVTYTEMGRLSEDIMAVFGMRPVKRSVESAAPDGMLMTRKRLCAGAPVPSSVQACLFLARPMHNGCAATYRI